MNKNDTLHKGNNIDGKYCVDAQIGAGGMGAVYRATHSTIGRKVAIKTLHADLAEDEQVVARFHREAQLAGSIGHDNICEVTDIGALADGSPYLVMPLLAGQAFADMLEWEPPIDIYRVLDIAKQTLSALEAAHGAGIVHRDLKPDNIFITKMGDRADFVKLLDFGISKLMDSEKVSQLTMTGTVLGTPFYMAPEQAKGEKDLDHRVDIYAMGVILYEALTGKRPFEGDSYNEVMFKIISEPFAPPSKLNPVISAELEQLIYKAMEREPADRFQTAAQMRTAIDDVLRLVGMDADSNVHMSAAGRRPPSFLSPKVAGTLDETAPLTAAVTSVTEGNRSKRTLVITAVVIFFFFAIGGTIVSVLFMEDDPQKHGLSKETAESPVPRPNPKDSASQSNDPIVDTKNVATPNKQVNDTQPMNSVATPINNDQTPNTPSANGKIQNKIDSATNKLEASKLSSIAAPQQTTAKSKKKKRFKNKSADSNKSKVNGRFGTTFVGYED